MKIRSAYMIALVVFFASAVSYGGSSTGFQVTKGSDNNSGCGGCGKPAATPAAADASPP